MELLISNHRSWTMEAAAGTDFFSIAQPSFEAYLFSRNRFCLQLLFEFSSWIKETSCLGQKPQARELGPSKYVAVSLEYIPPFLPPPSSREWASLNSPSCPHTCGPCAPAPQVPGLCVLSHMAKIWNICIPHTQKCKYLPPTHNLKK